MISLQYFNEQNVKIIKYGYCDLNLYMIMIYSDVDGRTVDWRAIWPTYKTILTHL